MNVHITMSEIKHENQLTSHLNNTVCVRRLLLLKAPPISTIKSPT